MGGLTFGIDGDGNRGYYGDDDVLIPFNFTNFNFIGSSIVNESKTYNIKNPQKNYLYIISGSGSGWNVDLSSSIESNLINGSVQHYEYISNINWHVAMIKVNDSAKAFSLTKLSTNGLDALFGI